MTYNGKIYYVEGTLIGSLTLGILQSLQPGHNHFQAYSVTQLTYLLNCEDYA